METLKLVGVASRIVASVRLYELGLIPVIVTILPREKEFAAVKVMLRPLIEAPVIVADFPVLTRLFA
jgi:hypothetical protein